VAVADLSEYLGWELRYLFDQGLQQKFFLFTQPELKQNGLKTRRRPLKGPEPPATRVDWQAFATAMRANGVAVFKHDPGPGAVITFDEAGRAVLLDVGACKSLDYVQPMLRWLSSKSGEPARYEPSEGAAAGDKKPVTFGVSRIDVGHAHVLYVPETGKPQFVVEYFESRCSIQIQRWVNQPSRHCVQLKRPCRSRRLSRKMKAQRVLQELTQRDTALGRLALRAPQQVLGKGEGCPHEIRIADVMLTGSLPDANYTSISPQNMNQGEDFKRRWSITSAPR